ncbi:IPT/TIG domain-containing protein [Urbifossiella limnaea]|uniref:IPT/TIG domain-containing protein n=1 Tax=Urbifossiella limnaea TaxID=2528023 RepID=UPI00192E6896|nr:IPT/TIG domain-containing protein [Urbifossiella limnaea]
MPALLGTTLFPADNPWNQRVADAPVAANSAAVMNSIVTSFGDNRLHPDFGQDARTVGADLYGIPYNVVRGNSVPKISVVIDDYADESDILATPIPADAVLEGDYQNGPRAGLANRGDSHLLVYDIDNQIGYEFFGASRPSENADGRWHAAQQSVWDMRGNTFRPLTWTSADAAGLAILPGLVRPDEALPVSQGGQGVINHAIRFTLQNSVILNQFVYPASHTANPGNTNAAVQPPMGSRFRLKAGVDISTLSPQSRVIAQAMKEYGLILADNGSNFFFSGASHSVDANNAYTLTFDDNDIQSTTTGLKRLRYSDFEMVDLTPAVTGLSVTAGAAGDTVTVTGRNFGGTAGRLSVLFGSNPGTNVTILSDSQLTVRAPAGSGAVDVKVKSGVDAPGVTQNVKNPVFGYGLSPVTAAGRFTYGVSPPPPANTPPTVGDVATQTVSAGGSTGPLPFAVADAETAVGSLGVTAASSNTTLVPSSGLMLGGSGGSRTITVTPAAGQTGTATITLTVTDAGGLTATDTFTLTVTSPPPPPPANAAPTVSAPASATPNPIAGTTTTLRMRGSDDGGEANLRYTWTMLTGPAGAAPVYSANGTNAARDITVTFNRAGMYLFQVTAADAGGLTITSSVSVSVVQTLTSITVTPLSTTLRLGTQTRFAALALDQFRVALTTQPTFTWTVASGPGTIDQSGLYTASGRRTGTALVQASVGAVKGTATVRVRR